MFLGPTLDAEAARAAWPDIEVRPPAARGDLVRAVRDGATHVGVVDGFFAHVPAIWHKEFLWALSRGVRVYGAASMGALRAAELAAFGVVPVGDVARRVLEGEIDHDDEVAVAHRDEEGGWAPVSEALVNVRATLSLARAEGVIPPTTHDDVLARFAAAHYPLRTWALVEPHDDARRALRVWAPAHRVDVKRSDALLLLDRMRDERDAPPIEPRRFEATDAWEALVRMLRVTQ